MSPIKYVIHENNLPTLPGAHTAQVQPTYIADLDDIVERIVGHGTTVARSDLYSALEDFFTAIEEFLQAGVFVRTPLACFRVSLAGTFTDTEDAFDPARHQVLPRIIPATRLRKALRDHSEVAKQRTIRPRPVPTKFVDVNTGSLDDVVTPGGAARLVGYDLKFDPADATQGVFFIAADNSETRAEVLIRNMPRELAFLNPALPAGVYRLQVRAPFSDAGDLRTGDLEAKLTVA
jgi:hypothetical protein